MNRSAQKDVISDIVGIDSGISMVMAENARTAFVWDIFMKNPEAQRGMERAGFKPYKPSSPQELVEMHSRPSWPSTHGR